MSRRPRVPIAGLVVAVAAVGIGLAALRSATGYAAAAMVTAAFVLLLAATLGAVWGRARPFWSGFALFGWAYAAVGLGPWFADDPRPHLLTTVAIVESYGHMHDARAAVTYATAPIVGSPLTRSTRSGAPAHVTGAPMRFKAIPGLGPVRIHPTGGIAEIAWVAPDFYAFERSAHCLAAVLVGLVGGGMAVAFAARRDGPTREARP